MNPIFLYIPNLICYGRLLLYFSAFVAHGLDHWLLCASLYTLAFVLDYWDGVAARWFQQTSRFGGALDIILDRFATTGFCVILAQLYPQWTIVFIFLIGLDIISHHFLTHYCALKGSEDHKKLAAKYNNRLMQAYYGKPNFTRLLITGNELTFILVYIFYYTAPAGEIWQTLQMVGWQSIIWICLPLFLLKQLTNILQLGLSADATAKIDLPDQKESPKGSSQ